MHHEHHQHLYDAVHTALHNAGYTFTEPGTTGLAVGTRPEGVTLAFNHGPQPLIPPTVPFTMLLCEAVSASTALSLATQMLAIQLRESGFALTAGVGEGLIVTAAPPSDWDQAAYRARRDAEVFTALGEPVVEHAPARPRHRALWRRRPPFSALAELRKALAAPRG